MDRPEVRADLHAVRMKELQASAAAIGFDIVETLGYRDSGTAGSTANQNPQNFLNADLDEAVSRLVTIIRRERPQVVITYPEQDRNRHPDHVRVHEVSVMAFERSGDSEYRRDLGPSWVPSKLYYLLRSSERVHARHAKFRELGMESPYDDRRLSRPSQRDQMTTQVCIAGFAAVRTAALRAHASQIDPESRVWFGLPPEVEDAIHPFDDYMLARGPAPVETPERDLFAGLP
jgi:mycothiol S-conjugate amidase